MRKLRTLFVKDENHLATPVLNIDWSDKKWRAYRKYDGTSCAVIGGVLYKRFDYKAHFGGKGNPLPEGAIACCDPDPITKHWPHWVPVTSKDKWHLAAKAPTEDGTYELCGPKVCTREGFSEHVFINHNDESIVIDLESLDYDYLKRFLETNYMEGLVIKYGDDWVKVRKGDFGFEW